MLNMTDTLERLGGLIRRWKSLEEKYEYEWRTGLNRHCAPISNCREDLEAAIADIVSGMKGEIE